MNCTMRGGTRTEFSMNSRIILRLAWTFSISIGPIMSTTGCYRDRRHGSDTWRARTVENSEGLWVAGAGWMGVVPVSHPRENSHELNCAFSLHGEVIFA